MFTRVYHNKESMSSIIMSLSRIRYVSENCFKNNASLCYNDNDRIQKGRDMDKLAVVRQWLSDGFSASEIDTMSFDLFHEIYGDIESVNLKSAKIQHLVDWCFQNGKMFELGQYMVRTNPNQARRYIQMYGQGVFNG